MPPHSKTVRGTLDNPKTKSAIESGRNPTQLGDPTSLSPEKDDSVPLKSVPDFSKPADPYRQNEKASNKGSTGDLPHSKRFRGTIGNSNGPTVNKSMLGDPVSLKAESSNNDMERGASGEIDDSAEEYKSKARKKDSKL